MTSSAMKKWAEKKGGLSGGGQFSSNLRHVVYF
jgi:hypothetical protein